MSECFGSTYAHAYDGLYHDKDYAAECDLIERIFQTHGNGAIRNVLDLGCGTGNHAIPLFQRGFRVVGVDRSESMLAQARKKLASPLNSSTLALQQGDIRTVDLQERFDAALMMFAVLGYQLENADILSCLRAAHRHLHPGGLLVFDVWYGPAVLRQRPSQRVKVTPTPGGKILRATTGELDIPRQICRVHYHVWRLEGERLAAETEEDHWMRYFFPRELELFLESAGFALVRLGAFPEFDQEPNETTWNVLGVARRGSGE
jgi:SAM-dependent methyltransferase